MCIEMAGAHPDDLFAADALPFIAKAADGVPRCLNHLADHSLLLAYVTERRPVTVDVVREALNDLKQLPLNWIDPISGSEVYRGVSHPPVMEDSAVNLWPQKPNVPNTAFRGDAKAAERQLARLAQVKATRDAARVKAALAEVERATSENRNVVPSVLEAVRAYATEGEIVDIWRRQFGTFVPSTDF